MSRRIPSISDDHEVAVPTGAPAWITAELISHTLQTWQPYYECALTADDALEILLDVGRLFDVLERIDG